MSVHKGREVPQPTGPRSFPAGYPLVSGPRSCPIKGYPTQVLGLDGLPNSGPRTRGTPFSSSSCPLPRQDMSQGVDGTPLAFFAQEDFLVDICINYLITRFGLQVGYFNNKLVEFNEVSLSCHLHRFLFASGSFSEHYSYKVMLIE